MQTTPATNARRRIATRFTQVTLPPTLEGTGRSDFATHTDGEWVTSVAQNG